MNYIVIILKVIIGLGILNVWLLRFNKPSRWRGGKAANMIEEFKVYGLDPWTVYLVGFLKVSLAVLLLISIWYPDLTKIAAYGIAILMLGAMGMHFRIRESLRSLPSLILLVLCLLVVYFQYYYQPS